MGSAVLALDPHYFLILFDVLFLCNVLNCCLCEIMDNIFSSAHKITFSMNCVMNI